VAGFWYQPAGTGNRYQKLASLSSALRSQPVMTRHNVNEQYTMDADEGIVITTSTSLLKYVQTGACNEMLSDELQKDQ
jgi:hypothetical protein